MEQIQIAAALEKCLLEETIRAGKLSATELLACAIEAVDLGV